MHNAITTNLIPTPHLFPFVAVQARCGPPEGLSAGSGAVSIEQTLKEGMSDRGAWNLAQFALIGIAWPPVKGWRLRLVREGVRVPQAVHAQFVALRNELRKPPRLSPCCASVPSSRSGESGFPDGEN